jgi:hypothetical protein
MKHVIVWVILMGLCSANTRTQLEQGRPAEIKIHDGNQVEMCVSNIGMFGHDVQYGFGCWWPKGSGQNYIFGAGVWFGTIYSTNGDTLVSIGYGPHGGETEFVPGLNGMASSHPDAIIYMYPENWPPPDSTFPMAPQKPVSDEDSWCCYNDCDSTAHVPGDGYPIGLEVYQWIYVWDEPFIDDVVFFLYTIKNVSGHNLYDCYTGICMDNDIGNESGSSADDQCTVMLSETYFINNEFYLVDNLGYQWDGDDYNQGWPSTGVLGVDLLQTPFDLQPGVDKDEDGIMDQYERDSAYYWNNVPEGKWDVDNDAVPDWRDASENPQLGMTAFKIFTLNFEPNKDPERYLTLAGYNYQTGVYEPFDTVIPQPDDQRFLMSSGPFNLEADSSLLFCFAVVLADWGDDANPPAETCLVITDHWAQWQYDMSWFLNVEEADTVTSHPMSLTVSPNPVSRSGMVMFSLDIPCECTLRLYDVTGACVQEIVNGRLGSGSHRYRVDTRALAQGTYFAVLDSKKGQATRSIIVVR